MKVSALLLGSFLFLSVSFGGGIAWLVSKLFHNSTAGLSLLCGGFLVGLLALDIIPSALKMYKSFGIILGIFIGYLFFLVLRNLAHPSAGQNPSVYLLMLAILIHTIPLSMTIGSLMENSIVGITITASVILHHLPEGFALTTAFISQGIKPWKLLFCFFGLSICFSLFIWIGHYVNLSTKEQGVLMGISIGLIAATSISEFILHNIKVVSVSSFITYIVMGYLLSTLFHLLL
ncbi:zinc transporter family protein [Sporosarcina sp. E16_8]|uniref:ZIP family metal transporter n=1 Tax=Sporosarcina sp. E16_8 TaxID=2789295 RepID=UPI001A936A1B|nr:zinc transporter family protein [Sporosarcina sp. E16_8]MBO0588596.1 zinc transporter family protein [Sporosarcina sp. E16_8]